MRPIHIAAWHSLQDPNLQAPEPEADADQRQRSGEALPFPDDALPSWLTAPPSRPPGEETLALKQQLYRTLSVEEAQEVSDATDTPRRPTADSGGARLSLSDRRRTWTR